MVQRKVLISLFLSAVFFNTTVLWGEEKFPFLAETNTDKVNIRSGQNTNFEKMASLNKGEAIVVLGKDFDWYKIQVPASAKVYIRQDYAAMEGNSVATVTATTVNVRSGAGTNFTSVGQLKKGDRVQVLDKSGEWLQIAPQPGMFAWVKKDFITFQSFDVSSVDLVLQKKNQAEVPATRIEPMKVIGRLEAMPQPNPNNFSYRIVDPVGGFTVCYVQGNESILPYFLDTIASVEGVNLKGPIDSSTPVIALSKIMLVL